MTTPDTHTSAVYDEQTRELAWTALLESDYATRYYAYLAARLRWWDRAASGLVVVLSSSSLVVLFADWARVSQVLAFITALVGVYLFSTQPAVVALKSAWESHRWGTLLREYELLWCGLDGLTIAEARQRWSELKRREAEGTETAPVEFPRHAKLVKKVQEEVKHVRGLEAGSPAAATAR